MRPSVHSRVRAARRFGRALPALLLAACGGADLGTGPGSGSDGGLVIDPRNASVALGATLPFTVQGTAGPVAWISRSPAVASISATGIATGLTAGTTVVVASVGGVARDSTVLAVVPSGGGPGGGGGDVGGGTGGGGPDLRCGGIAQATRLTGRLTFQYLHTSSGQKRVYQFDDSGSLDFAVPRIIAQGDGVVWEDSPTGTVAIGEQETDNTGPTSRVTFLRGSGAPVAQIEGGTVSKVTIAADLRHCTYRIGFVVYGNATNENGASGPSEIASFLSDARSVGATQLQLGDFPAHSVLWAAQHGDVPSYIPFGLAQEMFTLGVATDGGDAGTASIGWTFTR